MKSVLISINPKWCKKICNQIGHFNFKPIYEKGVEIRKTKPNIEMPFKAHIYCTKDNTDNVPSRIWWKADKTGFQHILNGMVIGEFVCNAIFDIPYILPFDSEDNCHTILPAVLARSCLTLDEMDEYLGKKDGYGWHITDLVIYDKPRELSEFHYASVLHTNCFGKHTKRVTRPPQSWCYVEVWE